MTTALDPSDVDRKAGLGVLIATCLSCLVVNANTSAVTILLPAIAKDVEETIHRFAFALALLEPLNEIFFTANGADEPEHKASDD